MFALLATLLQPGSEAWPHLRATVLPEYLGNTLLLMFLVGLGSLLIGVPSAWLTATRSFPAQRLLSVALVLPLAAPAYVVAYVYTDLLEFAGPVQSALRGLTGWGYGDYWFPPIRSLGGAAVVLTLVLYPYVYLLSRAAFVSQSGALFDAARSLGRTPLSAFASVALPTARPAIAGGLALVLMETAADFGVVEYFGVPTFTTGIFRTWYALGDRLAAMQFAAGLFIVVLAVVMLEFVLRRGRAANPAGRAPQPRVERLHGFGAALATLACCLPVLCGFVLPVLLLLRHAIAVGDPLFGRGFIEFVWNSVQVAGTAALIAIAVAVLLGYAQRQRGGLAAALAVRTASLGYALPGAVLGLAVLVPLTAFDQWFARLLRDWLEVRPTLLFTGGVAALVFAYVVRFLTAAYNATQGGFALVSPAIDGVARSLGARAGRLLWRIHLPLLRPAVLAGALLVFIDVLKELPATLILRPFNFETLATRVYRLASDERISEASTAALVIVALGTLSALLLTARARRPDT